MPRYLVPGVETYDVTYYVNAKNKREACKKFENGEYDSVEREDEADQFDMFLDNIQKVIENA